MADPVHTSLNELRVLMIPEVVKNQKLHCIKTLRQITGEGLKETKDFFEQVWVPFVTDDKTYHLKQSFNFDPDEILERLQALEEKVQFLSTAQTKATAKGIFNDHEA